MTKVQYFYYQYNQARTMKKFWNWQTIMTLSTLFLLLLL